MSSIALWTYTSGCSSKPLKNDGPTGRGGIGVDGGTAGSGSGNGGSSGSGGAGGSSGGSNGGTGTGGSGPTTGRRSYVVTSMFQRDGGIGSAPASHTFTLVLEADRRTAIAGGPGEGKALALEQTAAGALQVNGSTSFTIKSETCSGVTVSYSDLTFRVDANDQLTGAGTATLYVLSGDTVANVSATATLTGVADTQPPTLTIATGFDPLQSLSVRASEPLPPAASAVLRAADGETIPLSPGGTIGSVVTSFQKPNTTLRYGTKYTIVADGLTDFAGNAATGLSSLFFFTKPVPPMSAEDGFESVSDTTFAGVSVLSSADGPVIAGTKSLYIPGTNAGTISNPPTQPELLLRLPVSPGDTNVRFSYRVVRVANGVWYAGTWLLGSEGGTPAAAPAPTDSGAGTDVMVGGRTWTLGPLTTASFPLPAGATSEVVLQRTFTSNGGFCGPPAPAAHGLIIDDLRVE